MATLQERIKALQAKAEKQAKIEDAKKRRKQAADDLAKLRAKA